MDLSTAVAADFADRVGETFVLAPQGDTGFDVVLVEVTEGLPGGSRTQFSLVFSGGPDTPVPQGVHRLDNDALGALEIFLVPIGPGPEGQQYQAVFA